MFGTDLRLTVLREEDVLCVPLGKSAYLAGYLAAQHTVRHLRPVTVSGKPEGTWLVTLLAYARLPVRYLRAGG